MDKESTRYYESGLKCTLWGINVKDMSIEQLIVFIGYLDEVATYRGRVMGIREDEE